MKLFKNKVLIIAIVLGFILRVYQLNSLPALNADEAAIGYNAYSLIQTGRDEHGNAWPIHFQSFNDYKPGLYFYVVLPFVAILGLNEWAVRIPSLIIGVLTIYFIWKFVKELFPEKKTAIFGVNISLADISAVFLAVSPWHIHFSRGAWETNLATLLILLGLFFFYKGLKNSYLFVLSGLFFVLSIYTYHSARIVVPAMGALLLIVYGKELLDRQRLKLVLSAGLFTILILTPVITDFVGPAGVSRASGVSIFADPGHVSRINEKRGRYDSISSPQAIILHNKPKEYVLAFANNYFKHFWGEFLFLSGDEIQRNKVPEFGQLYLYQFPLILFAIFSIIKRPQRWYAILVWLAVSPFAASLTFQSPHALRAHNMIIPLTIISAYGLFVLLIWIKENINLKPVLALSYIFISSIFFWDTAKYIHQYYNHMAKTYPFSSQYGVKELVEFVKSQEGRFDNILITDRYDQPYVLFLFYLKYSPLEFQKDHELTGKDKYGFSTVRNFDKYSFNSISWDKVRDTRGVLVVGTDEEIPNEEANVIKSITFPNGETAFDIVELK